MILDRGGVIVGIGLLRNRTENRNLGLIFYFMDCGFKGEYIGILDYKFICFANFDILQLLPF